MPVVYTTEVIKNLSIRRWFIELMVRVLRYSALSIILSTTLVTTTAQASFTSSGEIYSETNYVPQYGLLTDTQLRYVFYKDVLAAVYLGAVVQRQDKTAPDQDTLYNKEYLMAEVGFRFKIWKSLHLLAEARTEDRSRWGVFLGDMWIYPVSSVNMFTEFYAEGVLMPSYHHDPVSTGWIKQGLRFQIDPHLMIDPYIELYGRRSPTPDLGRDTDQARAGVRFLGAWKKWSVGLLVYEAFVKDERSHNEALLYFGGSF